MQTKSNAFNTKHMHFSKVFTVNCEPARFRTMVSAPKNIITIFASEDLGIFSLYDGQDPRPEETYQWQFTGRDFSQQGLFHFKRATDPTQTEVRLSLQLEFKGKHDHPFIRGLLALGGDSWFSDTAHKFKQLIETGEIATTQGQSHGERGVVGLQLIKTKTYFNEHIEKLLTENPTSTQRLTTPQQREAIL